ncbi:MAG: PaaI family thioesterase [Thermodesulfobacteriota bacterium]|nr:PaaI family thioesterase [Thermodesulfobacteriota bacterium]
MKHSSSKDLSPLEVKEFIQEKDYFARHVGIELLNVSKGSARAKMDIKKHHLNGVGIVHGAAIFALADLVFAAASNSHGTVALAISVSISFVNAAKCETLYAEAREISRNPKLATYQIPVVDENDTLVASFNGMVYRKKDRFVSKD